MPTRDDLRNLEALNRRAGGAYAERVAQMREALGLPPVDAKTGQPKRKRSPSPLAVKLRLLNLFLDRSAQTVSPIAALVWVVLWRDERGGEARTAVTDLARRCGCSTRTAKRALTDLCGAGFLDRTRKGSPIGGPSVYRLRAKGKTRQPIGDTDGT